MAETLFGVSQSFLLLRPKVVPLLCYSDRYSNCNSASRSPRSSENQRGVSQSFLLLRPKVVPVLCYNDHYSNCNSASLSPRSSKNQRGLIQLGLSNSTFTSLTYAADRKFVSVGLASESKASDILTFDIAAKNPTNIDPDIGGGSGDGFGNRGGSGGGGGGSGNGGDNNRDECGDEGESSEKSKKLMPLSLSQKLTLGYAALVGGGGLMGYLKSGSQKSLLSGGISASILYYVYTQLPSNPVFASSLGIGVSAALLGAMGSRFKKSGKIFPAGVISLVSFVMTGGYLHGIMRSAH